MCSLQEVLPSLEMPPVIVLSPSAPAETVKSAAVAGVPVAGFFAATVSYSPYDASNRNA